MKNKDMLRKIYYENKAMNRNMQRLANIGLIGLLAKSAKKADGDQQAMGFTKAGMILVAISEVLIMGGDILDLRKLKIEQKCKMEEKNMLTDQEREEVFKPICRDMIFSINAMYRYLDSDSDDIEQEWMTKSRATTALLTLYHIASNRFIGSDDKPYDKYLIENSSEEERFNWVKFINGENIEEKEGPFKDYIDGKCEINESFNKILDVLNEKAEITNKMEDEKRESELAKIYYQIENILCVLEKCEDYSDLKLQKIISELNEITEKQDADCITGSFIVFYCKEIQKAYEAGDIEKLKEIQKDWKMHHNYIWRKI